MYPARGVTGLAADVREALDSRLQPASDEDGFEGAAVFLCDSTEWVDLVETLVAVAKKYGASE